MTSQYAVVASDLRATAKQYASVQSELGTTPPRLGATKNDAVGDDDLASWVRAVVDDLKGAHSSLHAGAGSMVTLLNGQADRYEAADASASSSIGQLMPMFEPTPTQPDVCVAPSNPASLFDRLGPQ